MFSCQISENNKFTLEYKNDYQVIVFDLLKHKFKTNRIALLTLLKQKFRANRRMALLTMIYFMLIENIY